MLEWEPLCCWSKLKDLPLQPFTFLHAVDVMLMQHAGVRTRATCIDERCESGCRRIWSVDALKSNYLLLQVETLQIASHQQQAVSRLQ